MRQVRVVASARPKREEEGGGGEGITGGPRLSAGFPTARSSWAEERQAQRREGEAGPRRRKEWAGCWACCGREGVGEKGCSPREGGGQEEERKGERGIQIHI